METKALELCCVMVDGSNIEARQRKTNGQPSIPTPGVQNRIARLESQEIEDLREISFSLRVGQIVRVKVMIALSKERIKIRLILHVDAQRNRRS
jgi:hypothetical protein